MESEQSIYTRCQEENLILVYIRLTEEIYTFKIQF